MFPQAAGRHLPHRLHSDDLGHAMSEATIKRPKTEEAVNPWFSLGFTASRVERMTGIEPA